MFPNIRFMIAAVVASVVALGSGFALFASFRVSHEPLSRLAGGAPPLQLAADSTMPSAATAESFGVRLQVIQAQPAGAAAVPPPVPAHDDNAAPADADTAPSVATAEPEPNAAAAPQAVPVAQAPVAPAAAPETKPDEVVATPREPNSDTAAVDQPSEPTAPAAPQTAAVESPPEPASPATSNAVVAPPAEQAQADPPLAQKLAPQQADQEAKPDAAAPQAPPPAAVTPPTTPPAAAAPEPPARHKAVRHTRLAARPRPAAPSNRQSGIGGPFVPAPTYAPTTNFASPANPAQPNVRARKPIAATPNTF